MRYLGVSVRRVTGSPTSDTLAFIGALSGLSVEVEEFDWREFVDNGHVSGALRQLAQRVDGILHPYVGSTRRLWSADFRAYLALLNSFHPRVIPTVPVYDVGCRKEYLLTLRDRGIPIIPTMIRIAPRTVVDLAAAGTFHFGTKELVIKPADGELSGDVRLLSEIDDKVLSEIVRREPSVLVQPFIPEIRRGQVSLVGVVVSGLPMLSHAVLKVPRGWHAFTAESSVREIPIEEWMASFLGRVTLAWPTPIDNGFVRVDVVMTASGPLVVEVETINPALALPVLSASSLGRFQSLMASMLVAWLVE